MSTLVDEINAINEEEQRLKGANTPTTGGVADFDVQSLLDCYAPKSEIFEVILPRGQVLKFRAFMRLSDKKRWERDAAIWWHRLPKRGSKAAEGHPLADVLPADQNESVIAHLIHATAVEPKFDQRQALMLLRAPELIEHIYAQIDANNQAMHLHAQLGLIEAAKKKLGRDPLYRRTVAVSARVWGKHPAELTEEQHDVYLPELIAVDVLEREERAEAVKQAGPLALLLSAGF